MYVLAVYILMLKYHVRLSAEAHFFKILPRNVRKLRVGQAVVRVRI